MPSSLAGMSAPHPGQVLSTLGLRAADTDDNPSGGMSGSALTAAVTGDGEPVIVKVSALDSGVRRDQACRELAVYTQLAPRYALPTPRLIAHHRAADWIAIAIARHEPAPPAPEWGIDDWRAFAQMMGRLHRTVRQVPDALRQESPVRVGPQGNIKSFAEQLWHGPGDRERIRVALDDLVALEKAASQGPVTFLHGDCHVGNVLHTPDRQPLLVDWQSARVGPSAADLAFAFTRAVPTGAAVPRAHAIAAYCSEAGADTALTDHQITAHQILTLVCQYPEFSSFLGEKEVGRLRGELDALLSRWRNRG